MSFTRPGGFKGPKIVSKVRRTKTQAYGTITDWLALSAACIRRDGYKCTRCKAPSTPGNRLEAHHIISVKMGGRSVLTNLRTLCAKCHGKMPHHSHLQNRKHK